MFPQMKVTWVEGTQTVIFGSPDELMTWSSVTRKKQSFGYSPTTLVCKVIVSASDKLISSPS